MEKYLGNLEQLCFAREVSGEYGKMIYVKCGKLFLSLNVDRCLDIYDLSYAGDNMAYLSAVGLNDYSLATEFSARFEGGFLYSCGLENIGAPTENTLTHGTMHHKKCKLTKMECLSQSVIISGIIDFSVQFGQKIKIRRTYEITQNNVILTDEFLLSVQKTAQIMQLYHFNFGYPMLDKDVQITFPGKNVVARNEHAQSGMERKDVFSAPIENFEEQCYICSCADDTCQASVENKKLGRKVTFRYSGKSFPKLVEWKSERAGDYALGIEPCTTHLDNKEYISVENGEKHTISIEIN